MLKYAYYKELFQEVPDEITLGISISGCRIQCPECHSKELWANKGTELNVQELERIIDEHEGITCVCIFGGEHDLYSLGTILRHIHGPKGLRTAWYCGLDKLGPTGESLLVFLDYLKMGHYDSDLGGLDNPSTNQRFYKVISGNLVDITKVFYNK